jgi:hypothetical protein
MVVIVRGAFCGEPRIWHIPFGDKLFGEPGAAGILLK